MEIRTAMNRDDLIQVTDAATKEPYVIRAEDFSATVVGDYRLVTKLLKALENKVNALDKKINSERKVKK